MMDRGSFVACLVIMCVCSWVMTADALGELGVSYGRLGDNLPGAADTMAGISRCVFKTARIYDSPAEFLLTVPTGGNVALIVGTTADDLPLLADGGFAPTFVQQRIAPFAGIPIHGIIVGNEAIPGPSAQFIPRAMANLRAALDAANLQNIYVSTTLYGKNLADSYPPSASVFSPESIGTITEIVNFMNGVAEVSRGPIFVHVYPYFAYASNPTQISLDYALFRPNAPKVQDGELTYDNLFDAMFDSYMWALEKIGGGGIEIAVGETGWPSAGNGDITTPALAAEYNSQLLTHITMLDGSPKGWKTQKMWPKLALIFAYYNENQKHPPGIENNWGLYNPDKTPVYDTPLCL